MSCRPFSHWHHLRQVVVVGSSCRSKATSHEHLQEWHLHLCLRVKQLLSVHAQASLRKRTPYLVGYVGWPT